MARGGARVIGHHASGARIPGLVIRTVRERDLAPVSELDRLVFGRLRYPLLRQLLDLHRDHWLIASRGTALCGYGLAVPSSDRRSGWLLGLCVHPDHRRLGLGLVLLTRSLDQLWLASVRIVRVTVKPGSGAVRLYQSVGFRAEKTVRDYLGPGEDRVITALRLDR
jgi:ribosomal protein S18 acetylase RimI-like enzyme